MTVPSSTYKMILLLHDVAKTAPGLVAGERIEIKHVRTGYARLYVQLPDGLLPSDLEPAFRAAEAHEAVPNVFRRHQGPVSMQFVDVDEV